MIIIFMKWCNGGEYFSSIFQTSFDKNLNKCFLTMHGYLSKCFFTIHGCLNKCFFTIHLAFLFWCYWISYSFFVTLDFIETKFNCVMWITALTLLFCPDCFTFVVRSLNGWISTIWFDDCLCFSEVLLFHHRPKGTDGNQFNTITK